MAAVSPETASDHYLREASSTSGSPPVNALKKKDAADSNTAIVDMKDDPVDNASPSKKDPRVCGIVLTRRRRLMLYWCAGVGLLLTAIMIPLLIFVIGPKIAQDSIEKSNLAFTSVTIGKAQNTSFALSSTGSISNAGFLDAAISFPDPVTIYWTNRPNSQPDLALGSLILTPISVSGSIPKFSKFLIAGAEFSWRLVGVPQATALGLTFKNLKMNKVVTMKGFSGLKEVTIKEFNLPDSDPTRGIRLITNTTLVNPAQITMELGDLYFDSYFKGQKLGDLNGVGIKLEPRLSEVFSFFVGGRSSKLVVQGTRVVPPLGEVSWLSAGFVGLQMEVSLAPPSNQQQLVSNIQIPSISVSFDPRDPDGYSLKTTAPTINAPYANVIVPLVPATGDQYKNTLLTNFTNADLNVVKGQETAFGEFFKSLTIGDELKVPIRGLVSTEASTAAGDVTIRDVSLTDTLTFKGFNGLKSVSIEDVQVRGGSASSMQLEIRTVIENPSNLSLFANADVGMVLRFSGEEVGTVVLPNLTVTPGDSAVTAGRKLLSDFLAGRRNGVSIVGSAASTPYKSLIPAFSALSINADLPVKPPHSSSPPPSTSNPSPPPPLPSISSSTTPSQPLHPRLSPRIHPIPRRMTPGIDADLRITILALLALVDGMKGELRVDATSTLVARVGDYTTTVDYEQTGLVTALGVPSS
ncbi:hypothetical protein BC829DRAFT_488967 [Chytridium lagenaria]|nr:hypothetical protein BC829DRAFT_488967 [Chytridium lagenaria]